VGSKTGGYGIGLTDTATLCSYNFDGEVLRVELAHGRDRRATSTRGTVSFLPLLWLANRREVPAVRHSDHRVVITGLPRSASWQDLKVRLAS